MWSRVLVLSNAFELVKVYNYVFVIDSLMSLFTFTWGP